MARQFRADLQRSQAKAMNRLADSYRKVFASIEAQLNTVTAAIEAAAAGGEPVSSSLLWKERRLERIRNQALEQIARLSRDAADLIESAKLEAVRLGLEQADQLIAAAYTNGPASIRPTFAGLPVGSVNEIVAATQHATPLRDLLLVHGNQAATAAVDTLLQGVSRGQNPRLIAAQLKKDLDVARWRAERIARTEVMRAHREATSYRYQRSELVEGWVWFAQSGSCCAACMAKHGTKHDLTDTLDGHPNCRCIQLPITTSWADLGYEGIEEEPDIETGAEIVAGMSQADLAARFGPGAGAALASGRLQIGDLAETRFDPVWGSMQSRRSLGSALENT